MLSKVDIESTGFTYYNTVVKTINSDEDIEKYAALADEYYNFSPFILELYKTSGDVKIRMYEGNPVNPSQYFFIGKINNLINLNSILSEIKLVPKKLQILYNSGQ